MLSTSLSSSSSSSSSSSRPRSSSWLQVVLFTVLVYILLFSTACCHAVPVWKTSPSQLNSLSTSKVDEGAVGGGIPSLPTGEAEFANLDSILERCMQAADNGELEDDVFVKTLCTLAMMPSRHMNGKTSHQGYVKRGTSDRTSFSAFNHFVNRLRTHAGEVSEYQDKLERLQAMGVIDSDYNVIAVPDEMGSLMRQLG